MVQLVQRKLLYTRGRAQGLQLLRLRCRPAAVLFLGLRLHVVGEPCLRQSIVRWQSNNEGACNLPGPRRYQFPPLRHLEQRTTAYPSTW